MKERLAASKKNAARFACDVPLSGQNVRTLNKRRCGAALGEPAAVSSSLVSGGLRRGGLLLQHHHRQLALCLLLVVAIERNPLHYLLPELLPLLARRHPRVRGKLLPADLHLDDWVGAQVQIP